MVEKANNMLANFDINKEAEPYKYYIDAETIQKLSRHYKIDPTNFSLLAEKLEDWNSDKGGVDEKGLFGISTKNPNGHIDYWSISDEKVEPEDREKFLSSPNAAEMAPRVLVTPDGKWVEGPWIYGAPNEEQDKELREFDKKATTFLSENKDTVIFFADCHI